jgi:drug/metabolite transporter (DMT)-like permease
MTRWKSDLILLLVAAVWGSGFVAQRLAAASLGAFYFNGGRFLLAALLLLPLTRFRWLGSAGRLPWMALAGTLLFAAAGFQQAGLATTTIGNASFITGLYVVLVPLLVFLIWRRPISWLTLVATGVAAVGVGLLSLQGELRLSPGDALELAGAFMWACHVILVGRLADQGIDVLWFAIIQFTVCGALSLVLAFVLDPPGAAAISASWVAILYSAVLPIGVGFTLQAAGQKGAPAVDAAIILSMEAVFGTLFGYLFLNELLSARQLFGCALILLAMILAQFRQPSAFDQSMEAAQG